jgi:hypothetical protein
MNDPPARGHGTRAEGGNMYYTISNSFRSYWRQERNHANIELANGAKCNFDFFWLAVDLGILSIDD